MAVTEVRTTRADLDARHDFRGVHSTMSKILALVQSRTVELPEARIEVTEPCRIPDLVEGPVMEDRTLGVYWSRSLPVEVPDSPAALAEAGIAPVSPAPEGAAALAVGELVQVGLHPGKPIVAQIPDRIGIAA